MPQRQDGHEHRTVGEAPCGAAEACVEHVIVVCARDQLRKRRRTARQKHRRYVGRPGPIHRSRRIGQAGQRQLARGRFAGHEHMLQPGELGLHFPSHDPEVKATHDIGYQIGRCTGCAQEMPHLGLAMRAQSHHRNDADHVDRKVADNELGGVRQLHQHEIAGPQANTGEAGGAVPRAREQFTVGQTLLPLH